MQRELKVRVDSLSDMEGRIVRAGGRLTGRATYEYVYFNQPNGDVLKITKKPTGTFQTIIKARDGMFDIVSSDPVSNEKELIAKLATKFGVKKKLINHRTFFAFEQSEVSLNDIEGLGNFLIIESEDPSLAVVARLGIDNPEVVTKSFDNL